MKSLKPPIINEIPPSFSVKSLDEVTDWARGQSFDPIMDWVRGPVYESLPKPLRVASSYTEDADLQKAQCAQAHEAYARAFAEGYARSLTQMPPIKDPTIGCPYPYAWASALGLTSSRAFATVRTPIQIALLDVDGLGHMYGHMLAYAIAQGVFRGYTPGEWVMERASEMKEYLDSHIRSYNKSQMTFNHRAPTNREYQALRVWWIAEGGTA